MKTGNSHQKFGREGGAGGGGGGRGVRLFNSFCPYFDCAFVVIAYWLLNIQATCRGWIYLDNCTCCLSEIEVADQTFYLTKSQCTDTRPTSPNTDHIMLAAWQGSH